jgi:malate dehydrogenase (oxaloacetate-decarboxylating)(NADP+)
MAQQLNRVLEGVRECRTPIEANCYLEEIHDRNETLYHRLIVDNIEELAPIIYTPTVGQACKEFGLRFRKPRGMYFSSQDKGQMAAMIYNWDQKDVHVCVVTDGSRILGLGDLGTNGMGIPIGKLALYCAAGGIAPHRVLPVVIDVGTDNEELLNDRNYLGIQSPRLKGKAYFEIVDEFMQAIKHRYPKCLIQFEDFNSSVAQPLLNQYRETHLCFNDDIQGTGATALAGVLGALRAAGHKVSDLGEQRILICGAGSAGIGVATVLRQAMIEQGRTAEEAKNAFFIADQHGLLVKSREDTLLGEQKVFMREGEQLGLMDIVKTHKPTILIGLTTVGSLFKEEMIKEMAKHVERPIIFPLSNPTSSAECTAQEAYEWTDGKVVFASGSPFPAVEWEGKTFKTSQCNNMFVFPGIGLGATLCGATTITDRMLYVAADELANYIDQDDLDRGMIFPEVKEIRDVSKKVAIAIITEAGAAGLAEKHVDNEDLDAFVESKMYNPIYVPLTCK